MAKPPPGMGDAVTGALSESDGAPVPWQCMLPGCTAGPTMVTRVAADGTKFGYCSPPHRAEHRRAQGRQYRCVVCRGNFQAPAAGRPPIYCPGSCRSARERALRRAEVELARDSDPRADDRAELEAQLDRAELLLTVWRPNRTGHLSMLIHELTAKHWDGQNPPPPRTEPPAPESVSALAQRRGRLARLLGELRLQERKAAREADERLAYASARRQQAERKEADKRWRKELLAGGD